MKKTITIILAAIFIASVFASCASAPSESTNSHIRLTSSDAANAAAWLEARLGEASEAMIASAVAIAAGRG